VVDAYSGIGTLALPLAKAAGSVIGVERWQDSVYAARQNAQRNRINNCSFVESSVESWLPRQKQPIALLCLDPPRKGCEPEVLQALIKRPMPRLIYVSCNPATLARDVGVLSTGGYRLTQVQPVDFFPQTYHVESIALLEQGV
jgi:23S rRNA (uracil1939-C5)-methyltransferase